MLDNPLPPFDPTSAHEPIGVPLFVAAIAIWLIGLAFIGAMRGYGRRKAGS